MGLADGSLQRFVAGLNFGHSIRVHSLPSRSGVWLQWLASGTSALQSRGGDGVAPSSRARSLRLRWRGKARYGLKDSEAQSLSGTGRPPGWGGQGRTTCLKKALLAAARTE
jgi:hypothetical protein